MPEAVLAAFNGSIDATSGRPGDKVTVVSADTGPFVVGATGLYFMPAVDPRRPESSIDCTEEPGSQFLGPFERLASSARLVFAVPPVAPGDYEVRMNVPGASPSCWRLWPFEVLAAPPATDMSPHAMPSWWPLSFVAAVGALAGLGIYVWLGRGRSGDIAGH